MKIKLQRLFACRRKKRARKKNNNTSHIEDSPECSCITSDSPLLVGFFFFSRVKEGKVACLFRNNPLRAVTKMSKKGMSADPPPENDTYIGGLRRAYFLPFFRCRRVELRIAKKWQKITQTNFSGFPEFSQAQQRVPPWG